MNKPHFYFSLANCVHCSVNGCTWKTAYTTAVQCTVVGLYVVRHPADLERTTVQQGTFQFILCTGPNFKLARASSTVQIQTIRDCTPNKS